jgi:hypothetical protein
MALWPLWLTGLTFAKLIDFATESTEFTESAFRIVVAQAQDHFAIVFRS